jgi:hypothetical protein
VYCSLAICLVFVVNCPAQQNSQDKPLGDVAREQQNKRKGQKKSTSRKTYTNDDVFRTAIPDSDHVKMSPPSATGSGDATPVKKPECVPDCGDVMRASQAYSSAAVCPLNSAPDTLVVPAGTEIRVVMQPAPDMTPSHVSTAKVVVPVRMGFETAIPALSKMTVKVTPTTYYNAGYNASESVVGIPEQQVVMAVVELTSLTVGKVTYRVKTNAIPLFGSPLLDIMSEMTFTLSEPLHVRR